MSYKDTLLLPQTDFPMKANLAKKEPEMLKEWDEKDIYKKIVEDRKDREKFVLHDGPPYANGHVHMGHVLNKVLKDIVVKSKTMFGYQSPYVPGWDCHGLPIEHNIEKELGKNKKNALTKAEFRKLCRNYAKEYIGIQKEEFKRLGVFGDWEKPYLTMNYQYEADTLRELGKFVEKDLVYKQKKPVYWCSSCKTALAMAEVEYQDDKSSSIYVKFDFISDLASEDRKFLGKAISAVIWTTTPWTIPANLAVCVNPEFDYSFVQIKEREVYIVASQLVESLMSKFGIEDYEVIKVVKGKELEGNILAHPLYDRESPIIVGDHVTLDAGTGLVHTAPGHGEEDYAVGMKYHLPIYSPVDDDGRFDTKIEEFGGMNIWDANPKIISTLNSKGMLVKEEEIVHSYPHCWRCKSPIIFRSTEQWFISIDKDRLRDRALEEIDNTKWIPSWGRNRIYSMMETRPDWCISRQRAWGVPIALFRCKKCGRVQYDKKLIDLVADKMEKEGADVWFEHEPEYFLPDDYKCTCGSSEFEKETDILDVWFDSGVSHSAVLERRDELKWPADMYLEGSDQHRGWFHSSLLESVGTRSRAPYNSVLTHGFVVDSKGRKMSKSLGNVIAPEKIIKKYGAELLRLWASATDYKDDVRLSDEIMTRLVDNYRKIRNTIRFLLGNLNGFNESNALNYSDMEEIDRWVLSETELLKEKIRKSYEDYDFHVIYRNMANFCITILSSFYLDILKDRLYCEKENSTKRLSAQTAMNEILKVIVFYMAPILSFTAEEAYSYMNLKNKKESVHMEEFVELKSEYKDESLISKWRALRGLKESTDKALELARSKKLIGNSLEADIYVEAEDKEVVEILKGFELYELSDICIVSHFHLGRVEDSLEEYYDEEKKIRVCVTKANGKKCERCWKFDESVGNNESKENVCSRCYGVIH